MKEVTRIHLAKTPFSIELDAKKRLEKYLHDIQKTMSADSDAMREIEARAVELLAERNVSRDGVISLSDVDAICSQMGDPREFTDDEASDQNLETNADQAPQKQLMRDTENGLIGGVCAGIAAYFGINPLWPRLVAIFSPFVTFGTAILIYIVMWLSIPEARTASDKLRMRGEPVTLESIKKLSTDNSAVQKSTNIAAKMARFFIGWILVLVALGLLVGVIVGGAFGIGVVSSMNGFAAQNWFCLMLSFLIIGGGILVALAALVARSVFKWELKKPVLIAIFALLTTGAICLSGVAVSAGYATTELHRDYQRLSKIKTVDLADKITDANSIEFVGDYVSATYAGYSEKPYLEVMYYETEYTKAPEVAVSRSDDKMIVNVTERSDDHNCIRGLPDIRCYRWPRIIKFYGPSNLLEKFTWRELNL